MTEKPRATLSGREPEDPENIGAPAPIDPATGMHRDYWVLPEEERAKGYIRPLRDAYRHVGQRPKYPTRALTALEEERYVDYGYACFEVYPESEDPLTGRYWTAAQLESGCGGTTRMAMEFAETYARDPKFYGSTFCGHCRQHFPVEEFVWEGTDERVGS